MNSSLSVADTHIVLTSNAIVSTINSLKKNVTLNFNFTTSLETAPDAISNSSNDNCFVLKALDPNMFYSYPLDIYNPKSFRIKSLQKNDVTDNKNNDNRLINCTASESNNNHNPDKYTMHSCSSGEDPQFLCPVHDQNIIDATSKTLKSNGHILPLCVLESHLSNPHGFSNIIVFGGSVTVGRDSYGCETHTIIDRERISAVVQTTECNWFHFFGEVIRQYSNATVRIVNSAVFGSSSAQFQNHFTLQQ